MARNKRYDFDYYSYDGDYLDTYKIGDPIVLKGSASTDEITSVDGEGESASVYVYDLGRDLKLADAYFNADKMSATYRFTDIYGQNFWTPVMP